jgi:hypothetical protein
VKVKKYLLLVVVLFVFSFSLVIGNLVIQAQFPPPYVKFYVNQPLGYIPFVTPGGKVNVDIMIEMSGIPDDSSEGIVSWGMTVCWNPDVLELVRVIGERPGYLLYDFGGWLPEYYEIQLDVIPPSPGAGCVVISEVLIPTPFGGAGDSWSGWKLATLQFESKSDTQTCLIDLKNAEYMTPDGTWHAVDIVLDGQYGTSPSPVPEFPIGLALEVLFIPVIIYIFWRSKQRKKILPKNAPINSISSFSHS